MPGAAQGASPASTTASPSGLYRGGMRPARVIGFALAGLIATLAAVPAAKAAAAAPPPSTSATPTGGPVGTTGQQTHPSLVPRRGTRRTRFSVRFTLADAPGHRGVMATSYRVQVDQPSSSRAACAAPGPRQVDSGTRGEQITEALPRPRYGWCRGSYTVRVFLQRGPYCPKPQDGQPPQPCPLFASQEIAVGTTRFTVTPVAK